MVKVLVALLVVLALGAGVYVYLQAPTRRVCLAMGDLCDGRGDKRGHYDDFSKCVDSVSELSDVFGEEAIVSAARCVDEAENCADGMTCMAGVAVGR